MEFRQLRYFVAVAEIGNIGLAAQRLHVSQPPVTRQIQALEHELGAQLLIRTPRGVELTEAGRVFHREAAMLLEHAARARERSRDAHRGLIGRLDVAFFGSTVHRAVPEALRAFRRAHPGTEIRLTRMGKGEQIDAVREGRVHVGFGRYFPPAPGVAVEVVGREPLHAALPCDLSLAASEAVTMEALARLPLVLFPAGDRPGFADEVLAAFREAGHGVVVDSVAADSSSALALVASGDLAAVVPSSVAALRVPGLRCPLLVDCPVMAPIACAFRESGRAPVLERFLEVLRASPSADG